jgi:homoserine O-acetyltransferase
MNSHDVGRGRGGVTQALARITAEVAVVAVDSDRLYPPRLSHEIADAVPGAQVHMVHSDYGHDGFLIEIGQVGRIVATVLSGPA